MSKKYFQYIIVAIFAGVLFFSSSVWAFEKPRDINIVKPSSFATTFIVDANGVVGVNGCTHTTLAAAFASFAAATKPVLYRIRQGNYILDSATLTSTLGQETVIEPYGGSDGEAVITPGGTGGMNFFGDNLIIDGGTNKLLHFSSGYNGLTAYFQPRADHLTISNCRFDSSFGVAVVLGGYTDGADYARIFNNDISSTNSAGIYLRSGDNVEIRNNYFHDVGAAGLQVNPHLDGEHVDNLLVSGNVFTNCMSNDDAHNVLVLTSETTNQLYNVSVFNNLFFGNMGLTNQYGNVYGFVFGIGSVSNAHIDIYNNTAYNNYAGLYLASTAPFVSFKNNIMLNNVEGDYGYLANENLDENENNIDGYNTDDTDATPAFLSVNSSDDNFLKLSSTDTACLDKGSNLSGIVTNDYLNTVRPQGLGYDIGAFEYHDQIGSQPDTISPSAPSGVSVN